MRQVIGFTGYAQSGKDTAAGFLIEQGYQRLSFADALRDSLYALNPIVSTKTVQVDDQCFGGDMTVWERVQDVVDRIGYERAKVEYPEIRQLLQRFGTDVGRALYGEGFWVDRVTNQMHQGGKYVISDVRFQNEALAVQRFGGKVFRIVRPGTGAVNTHISDTGIDSLIVDGVIPNVDGLDHFRGAVLEAVGIA